MSPHTGALQTINFNESVPAGFVEVKRPLTIRERFKMQINKYAPCGCGSGKKFKFCCYKP